MGDLSHCAATTRRWALATWRALDGRQQQLLIRLAAPGPHGRRHSSLTLVRAELAIGELSPELTPLGRLVASVGAVQLAGGGR